MSEMLSKPMKKDTQQIKEDLLKISLEEMWKGGIKEGRKQSLEEVEKLIDDWWSNHDHKEKKGLRFMHNDCFKELKSKIKEIKK